MAADAWANVSADTLVNCWRKTGILPPLTHQPAHKINSEAIEQHKRDEKNELNELIGHLQFDDSMNGEGNIILTDCFLYE